MKFDNDTFRVHLFKFFVEKLLVAIKSNVALLQITNDTSSVTVKAGSFAYFNATWSLKAPDLIVFCLLLLLNYYDFSTNFKCDSVSSWLSTRFCQLVDCVQESRESRAMHHHYRGNFAKCLLMYSTTTRSLVVNFGRLTKENLKKSISILSTFFLKFVFHESELIGNQSS